MYRYLIRIASISFNAIVLSMTIDSYSANAQHSIDLGEFNQSREFFDEGKEIVEEQIKWLQQDVKLPQIKLPENSFQSQDVQNPDFIYANAKLQPISEPITDWE